MSDDARLGLGGNKPPSMIGSLTELTADMSAWLSEHPVLQTEEQAREAKSWVDRGVLATKDAEDERKAKTDPLNAELKRINGHYAEPRSLLQRVVDELKHRLGVFITAEEIRRAEIIKAAAERARQAEELARLAERRETEALVEADSGVLGVDIAAVSHDADIAFAEFQKAGRAHARAEADEHVKIGGGFRRSASFREHDVIMVTDVLAFIKETGMTHDIEEAMRKVARAFKKVHGRWPAGVEVHTERKVV
jgi:hypothetical protein